jgi:hypothetical protein
MAGVADGGLDSRRILLTAIAGTVAGAMMCAGEFVTIVGGVETCATRCSFVTASLENLVIAVNNGLAYGVGSLFDNIVKLSSEQRVGMCIYDKMYNISSISRLDVSLNSLK